MGYDEDGSMRYDMDKQKLNGFQIFYRALKLVFIFIGLLGYFIISILMAPYKPRRF